MLQYKLIRKANLKLKFITVLFLTLILSNVIAWNLLTLDNYKGMGNYEDVDRRENGNTFIAAGTVPEILYHTSRVPQNIPVEENSPYHRVIEVDKSGNVVWQVDGMAYVHEIYELPNGNLMVADCGHDRICEVDYKTKEIIWEWKPADINWEDVNPEWDADHYYNNPFAYDWSHLNDVDFKDYGSWTAMLVSIRNFDLIVEIDFTIARNYEHARAEDIIWYYGDYQDNTLLNHQHNPDYLKNGNIIIADSDNHRMIEVDYNTKEIVWKYEKDLSWSRDCDELENGNFLITDACRVFELDRTTFEIVWEYTGELISGYESDRLDNGNTLIGGGLGGKVYEVDSEGNIVWSYGIPFIKTMVWVNIIIFVIFETFLVYVVTKLLKSATEEKLEIVNKQKLRLSFLFTVICIQIVFSILVNQLTVIIFNTIKTAGQF